MSYLVADVSESQQDSYVTRRSRVDTFIPLSTAITSPLDFVDDAAELTEMHASIVYMIGFNAYMPLLLRGNCDFFSIDPPPWL